MRPPAGNCANHEPTALDVNDAHAWLLGSQALERILLRAFRPLQLIRQSWLILEELDKGARAPSELARALHMQRGSLSRWPSRLSDDGFVDCRCLNNDRRCKRASLNDAGRHQLASARASLSEILCNTEITAHREERQATADLSRRLQVVFEQRSQGHRR